MEAKLITGDEPLFSEKTKWDYVEVVYGQLADAEQLIVTALFTARLLGEDTADFRTLNYLVDKVRSHFRQRGNELWEDKPYTDDEIIVALAKNTESDEVLTLAQFKHLYAHRQDIHFSLNNGVLSRLNAIADAPEFKALFGEMNFDEAWDRYGGIEHDIEHPEWERKVSKS